VARSQSHHREGNCHQKAHYYFIIIIFFLLLLKVNHFQGHHLPMPTIFGQRLLPWSWVIVTENDWSNYYTSLGRLTCIYVRNAIYVVDGDNCPVPCQLCGLQLLTAIYHKLICICRCDAWNRRPLFKVELWTTVDSHAAECMLNDTLTWQLPLKEHNLVNFMNRHKILQFFPY